MKLNPFDVPYITEASYGPTELLDRYSFLPFTHLQAKLGSPTNVFLVGRKGVGKTMLLKLFDPDLMLLVYDSTKHEHAIVRKLLPKATVGVYFSLASPGAKLNLFQGQERDQKWWLVAYSDYLNCLLLRSALEGLLRMSNSDAWRDAAGLTDSDAVQSAGFFRLLITALRAESSAFDCVDSQTDLEAFLQHRIVAWTRFVNGDRTVPEPPSIPLHLGSVLFRLTDTIRRLNVFKSPFRLFLLLDQYETLYDHRRVCDFRPIFNQAMYAASRGGTGVEFKIGARQYSHTNLSLLEGAGGLENNREVVTLDVDRLANKFYKRFVLDLFGKRMQSCGYGVPSGSPVSFAERQLPSISPRDEAIRYLGTRQTGEIHDKHLSPFVTRWQSMGLTDRDTEAVLSRSLLAQAHPLTSTLACIALTRWLRDACRHPLIGEVAAPSAPTERVERCATYARALIGAIDARYLGPRPRDTSSLEAFRKIDNFVRDAEQVSLFILASSYKNQRKYYAGIESITRLSSNVAVVFIELLNSCYELLLLDGGDPGRDPVTPQLQREAIIGVSESYYQQLPIERDFGKTFQELVSGLGTSFRRLQLELTAPIPNPNGFSISPRQRDDSTATDADPRKDPYRLLLEAVSWGILEESEHQDKTRGRPRRIKYNLNRILCPYFGLSDVSKKDPMYVENVDQFITSVLAGDEPAAVGDRLRESRGESKRARFNTQPRFLL